MVLLYISIIPLSKYFPIYFSSREIRTSSLSPGYLGLSHPHAQSQGAAAAAPEGPPAWLGDIVGAEVGVKPLVKTMVISTISYNVRPQDISWFRFAPVTIVINAINHSYCSYKPT